MRCSASLAWLKRILSTKASLMRQTRARQLEIGALLTSLHLESLHQQAEASELRVRGELAATMAALRTGHSRAARRLLVEMEGAREEAQLACMQARSGRFSYLAYCVWIILRVTYRVYTWL